MPRGVISNREYTTEDIFSPVLYPRMKEEPLLDDDDCLVVPVRNENAPHFRRLGNPSFRNRIGRTENNQHMRLVYNIYLMNYLIKISKVLNFLHMFSQMMVLVVSK